MDRRRVWVRRPHGSATTVLISPADIVDDLKTALILKYAVSLGRSFDSPDLVIKLPIQSMHSPHSRSRRRGRLKSALTPMEDDETVLLPDLPVLETLDKHYPAGTSIVDALLVLVPDDYMAQSGQSSRLTRSGAVTEDESSLASGTSQGTNSHGSHSQSSVPISSQVHRPQPQPIQHISQRDDMGRPVRSNSPHKSSTNVPINGSISSSALTHAKSPLHNVVSRHSHHHHLHHYQDNNNLDHSGPNSRSSSPVPQGEATSHSETSESSATDKTSTQPSQQQSLSSSDQPVPQDTKAPVPSKPPQPSSSAPNPSLLDAVVPPIKVLIVEDNIINQKILEAFMKKRRIRSNVAKNGKEAIEKWREGGYHLVLMDIQLPVLSGIEAAKEIRRLERRNRIGVFFDSDATAISENDVLPPHQFKSPVIIVALTASSLDSDRREALAAGCNDFLTKPVSLVWLERKITEWGCMQALIDFEGWRQWKGTDDGDNTSGRSSRRSKHRDQNKSHA
ncbi:hypothetical protein V1511DRAFT_506072 [Dipodascopsis uninucleata]